MYNILSLDGGGSWAILQLLTLKDKYGDINGHHILREFDLVIANSGGSIVLAALAEDWKLSHALKLFQDKSIRERIFQANTFKERFFPVDYLRLLGINIGPKYSSIKKKVTFRDLFQEVDKRQMSELPKFIGKESLQLVVVTYDALNNRAKFFQSSGAHKPDYDSVTLTQAIDGSSNAPVQYFDFPIRFKARKSLVYFELWDGALGGFNNPILAGIIEAIKNNIPLTDIQVVSIGTGNKLISQSEKDKYWKLKQDTIMMRKKKFAFGSWKTQFKYFMEVVMNQSKTILYEPPDWANYVANIFLSRLGKTSGSQIIRLSPLIHIDSNTPASAKQLLETMYNLDMNLTEDRDIEKLVLCFDEWKKGNIGNQPLEFKVDRNNDVQYIVGDKTYDAAMARW